MSGAHHISSCAIRENSSLNLVLGAEARDGKVSLTLDWHRLIAAFNILLGHGRLAVDHYHRLFWPSASDDSHMKWMNTPIHPDIHLLKNRQTPHGISGAPIEPSDEIIPWDEYPTLGQHQLTGQIPLALHFNGKK